MENTLNKSKAKVINDVCQNCHSQQPLVRASFSKNTGLVLLSHNVTVKGFLCRQCLRSLFKEYQIHNLLLGWWGLHSLFIINPMYLIMNTWNYYFAVRNLKKYPSGN